MNARMDRDEILAIIEMAAVVGYVPPVSERSLEIWADVLETVSYHEAESAIKGLARNWNASKRIGPGEVWRVVKDRREQWSNDHPSGPYTRDLVWSHRARTYVEAGDPSLG